MSGISRRDFAVGSIVSVTSIAGVSLFSRDASGAEVSGEFSVPAVDRDVVHPVDAFRLNVTGTAAWQAETLPDRVVLRLKIGRNGAFEQLDAMQFSDLSRDFQSPFEFSGVNLLSHSRISIGEISPTETGETVEMSLTARLILTVQRDGRELGSDELETTIPIEVTKTAGDVEISMGASGDIEISQATPTESTA